MIYCVFPLCGKTYMAEKLGDNLVSDSDSSSFSWTTNDAGERVRNPEFPGNYVEHLKKMTETHACVLASTHKQVLDELEKQSIEYILVHPAYSCKLDWLERYDKRETNGFPRQVLEDNWDKWSDDIHTANPRYFIALSAGDYLIDKLLTKIVNATSHLLVPKDIADSCDMLDGYRAQGGYFRTKTRIAYQAVRAEKDQCIECIVKWMKETGITSGNATKEWILNEYKAKVKDLAGGVRTRCYDAGISREDIKTMDKELAAVFYPDLWTLTTMVSRHGGEGNVGAKDYCGAVSASPEKFADKKLLNAVNSLREYPYGAPDACNLKQIETIVYELRDLIKRYQSRLTEEQREKCQRVIEASFGFRRPTLWENVKELFTWKRNK